MGVWYPQAGLLLTVRWEDQKPVDTDASLRSLDRRRELRELQTLRPGEPFRIQPQNVTVDLNSYAEADSFRATLDYKNFPFDPRTIRSVHVTVHMEDMKGVDRRIVPSLQNLVFVGFCDNSSIDMDETDRTVMLEGRDLTSLFLDLKKPGFFKINWKNTFEQELRRIVNFVPGAKNIMVEVDPPLPGEIGKKIDPERKKIKEYGSSKENLLENKENAEDIENQREEAKKNRDNFAKSVAKDGSNLKPTRKEANFWDVITALAADLGYIAYMDRGILRARTPRNFYSDNNPTQYIYGHNLASVNFERKTGRKKKTNLLLTSVDNARNRPIKVKIPQDVTAADGFGDFINKFGSPQEKVDGKMKPVFIEKYDEKGKFVENQEAETLSFPVPTVKDRISLIAKGVSIYEEIIRQHLEGEFATHDMLFFKRNGEMMDISKISVGDYVNIGMRMDDLDKIKDIKREPDRRAYLESVGYPGQVAREFARTLSSFKYNFFLRSVRFSVDPNGFTMGGTIINIIEPK